MPLQHPPPPPAATGGDGGTPAPQGTPQVRAAHTHHGGGRGFTDTPLQGPGSREASRPRGSSRVATVTRRRASSQAGRWRVRVPPPPPRVPGGFLGSVRGCRPHPEA